MPAVQKYGLLIYNTWNLGDEIQSLAARRFLPYENYWIERDNINAFKEKGSIKLILNGWFTSRSDRWPPRQKNLNPLIISFHISAKSRSIIEGLTSEESIKYYKEHEPIGCRDLHTLGLLKKKGVDAYFSGCLTLTLRNQFKKRLNNIYFVDVNNKIMEILPRNLKNITFLSHRLYRPRPNRDIKKSKRTIEILRMYVQMERFRKAQELLDAYAQAKLVVTSNLHCALPCLAFGTPVVFIYENFNDERFSGNINLMRSYSLKDIIKGRVTIDWDNPKPNPVDISFLRDQLTKTCEKFINRAI